MYHTQEFNKAWEEWKEHKQEKFGLPYTAVAERKALAALWQKSHGIEQLAIDSIDYSIENNWSAIYIKPSNSNNGKFISSAKPNGSGLSSTAIIEPDKRFNASL